MTSTLSTSNHCRAIAEPTSGLFWWSATTISTFMPFLAGPKSSTAMRAATTEPRPAASGGGGARPARRFRLDRAVVNNWVKSGYVPARWAMEVEHVTGGQIPAVEILNEANARKPIRLKSRPDGENLFGSALTG